MKKNEKRLTDKNSLEQNMEHIDWTKAMHRFHLLTQDTDQCSHSCHQKKSS